MDTRPKGQPARGPDRGRRGADDGRKPASGPDELIELSADPAAPSSFAAAYTPPAGRVFDDERTLRDLLAVVAGGRKTILVSLAIAVAAGLLYLVAVKPKYRADTLVQVDEKSSGTLGLQEVSAILGVSPANTEIEVLQSRILLAAVIDVLRLDVVAEPRHLPVLGQRFAEGYAGEGVAPPLLGLSSFAWGGERIAIPELRVPERWEGRRLTVVAREGAAYDLSGPDGTLLGRGRIGERATFGETTLRVSELRARDGTRFDVEKVPRAKAIERFRKHLRVAEKGKKTGLIEIALEGADPRLACEVLDALASTYARQDVERRSAEAEAALAFVNDQLPRLKANADKAERALNAYRKSRLGGFDFGVETKAALDRAAAIDRMLTEIELQRSELRSKFAPSHPAIQTLDLKESQLREQRAGLDRQLAKLPDTQSQSALLMRDSKVAAEIYVLLLNKAQELSVMKSGALSNVRVLGKALASAEPVSPRPALTLLASVAFGLALGVALVIARQAFRGELNDPDAIERETGLSVFATVPYSRAEGKMAGVPLATREPGDLAVEALRNLRTTLEHMLGAASNNIVAVMGPSPGTGKSFVALNLAQVLADGGSRVLLVDADLRRGTLHSRLGIEGSPGISELLQGTSSPGDAVRCVSERLHVVPCGRRPERPSELLASRRFAAFLMLEAQRFDVVLIDTVPILAVADAAVVARRAGTVLLVLRAGMHPARELSASIRRLVQNGIRPRGVILNGARTADSYEKYGHHYR